MNVIQVVDVPAASSADDAQRLLNAPCAENRYLLVQVLQLPGGATRAIYRLRVERAVTKRQDRAATGNTIAAIQQRIERVLRSKGPLARHRLYKLTNGWRDGLVNWNMALDGLVREQLAGKTDGKVFWAKAEG